ncbi:MAG: PAS domain S-box protein, partial [Bacteroidetes bacterium]|nr:PAS domain S-box protein [Bacteroidota bacterium]
LHERDQTAPPPRFAEREPPTQPFSRGELLSPPLAGAPRPAPNPVLLWLKNFFMPPVLSRAYMPDNMNPSWAQTIEQAVTVSARLIMVFGTLTALNILANLNVPENIGYVTAIVLFLAVTYFVAFARTTPFHLRIGIFLFLVYVMALAEMLKFGFSSDIFLYFMVLIILAHMLLDVRGGFWMLALSVATMVAFAWFVLSGMFVPTQAANIAGLVQPVDVDSAATSIMVYLFSSLTMMTVVNMFILNLNQAWKKETQALNLVQQERDMLEQRVIQRTSALADARDLAIQRSNELRKYFLAIEQSGNMVVITDIKGNIEYVNPRFTQLTGYALDEGVGQNLNILNSGEHSDEYYATMWQKISSGEIWHGEFHNRRKDGSLFWESATIAPVHSQDGDIINYVAIKEDITADKELREQLQKQNEYLSILHQTTLDLLNRRSLDDLLNAVVERACSLLDAPLGEIMLKEDDHMVVRAATKNQPFLAGEKVDRSQAKLTWQAHDTGQPVVLDDYSTWLGRRTIYDSNPLHAVADFPVLIGGECIGVLALGRNKKNYPFSPDQIKTGTMFAQMVSLVLDNANLYDSALQEIEQRKQAEKLLQESESRFRQIVENASDIIYRADTEGHFIYVNPTALNIMGFKSEAEVVGRSYLDLARPEWKSKLRRFYVRQFLRAEESTYFEFEAVAQDGRDLWIGQNVQIIRQGEKVVGFQAVARDITSLKHAQEALSLARDQALDASRFKSQMLAKISHELRTPLGAVMGYAELLQNNLFGVLNEKQKDAADNIVDSANYLNTIIGELLDQAQIESRSVHLRNLPFSPTELAERVASTMTVLAQKKGIALRHSVAPELPETLLGDSKRLQQILINLTGNAIKFTDEGSVSIELLRPADNNWSIRISDTGTGIPKEAREYIFEPFRQVDNAITHYNRGTGLGLSITKQLVELMGGHISLESEVGRGSTFTVILPIVFQ